MERSGEASGDEVPQGLKRWFVVHGVVDWMFAIPLFLFPDACLRALGWAVVDPMAARGVAAALVGIGTQSLLARNASGPVYRELLSLKIFWSSAATVGFAWTALSGGPQAGWVFVAIFALFGGVWIYWQRRLSMSWVSDEILRLAFRPRGGPQGLGPVTLEVPPATPLVRLRAWHRLSVRTAGLLVGMTLLAISLVGALIYQHQKRELQETLGTLLLNIARTGALLVDPALHAEVRRTLSQDSDAYQRVSAALAAIQDENGLETPIYTLTDFDQLSGRARFMVTSRGPGAPGELYPLVPALIEPLWLSFRDNVAAHTGIYRNQSGTWITAFAPIRDATGRIIAVLDVDYRVDIYLDRLAGLRTTVLLASLAGAIGALLVGLLFARRLTGPITALTHGARRVADGELSQPLPVRSRDEVGQLTQTFNAMLEGLRQRDFIRDTFGRYVSPEVARAILELPGGLDFGGAKRDVTVLMSDLRGYTRFAEMGEPGRVVAVLNDYLARMADIIIAHGGTINEFIGDAIFAVFGAPAAHPDHAERAAGAALAMQRGMREINAAHERRGLPGFEMGIGINTGEAVLGNIGSERRAKYAVVGHAVNVAGRVEGCTVGGQILISAATFERIRDVAEVGVAVPVAVKGLAEPLLLYELRGLGGRFAGRLPETESGADLLMDVTLPLRAWVIDGKIVSASSISGVVLRLGTRQLDVQLDEPLAPLTNIRLRLNYPGLGYDSGDLYGKITGCDEGAGTYLTRIRLTSVEPLDQRILEGFFVRPT